MTEVVSVQEAPDASFKGFAGSWQLRCWNSKCGASFSVRLQAALIRLVATQHRSRDAEIVTICPVRANRAEYQDSNVLDGRQMNRQRRVRLGDGPIGEVSRACRF